MASLRPHGPGGSRRSRISLSGNRKDGPRHTRMALRPSVGGDSPGPITREPQVADSASVVAASPVSAADLKRAEQFAREPFVLEGETRDVALAEGTPRRAAFDAALGELEAGREEP